MTDNENPVLKNAGSRADAVPAAPRPAMVAASIVTYHTDDEELRRCLSSLSPKLFDRITVIDNSSSENTRRLCAQWQGVTYCPSENIGYGAAHNIAIRQSLADGLRYHLVLNTDIRFNDRDFPILIHYMDSHPDTGALQPMILSPDGTQQYTVRLLPTPFDLILRRFLPGNMMQKRRNRYELRHIDHTRPFNAPYHQGSFMLLRCEALRDVGLFDERFFMYPEDIDLTRRIHERWRTMYVPDMKVIHDHKAESYHSFRMLRIHIINMIRYFNKWGWFFDRSRKRFNSELL